MKKHKNKIFTSFFCNSDGIFQPIYYYAFVILHLTIIMIICRIVSPLGNEDKIKISDTLIGIMMTYVLGLIGLYNYVKYKNKKYEESKNKDEENTKEN